MPDLAGPHRKSGPNCLIIQVGKLRLREGSNLFKVEKSVEEAMLIFIDCLHQFAHNKPYLIVIVPILRRGH